jgi:hypothetical protein
MDIKGIASKLTSVAPILGTLIAGPAGTVVGSGIKLLAETLGLKEDELTPEKLEVALSSNPETLLKLRELDNNLIIRNGEINLEETKARLADVASARAREVSITQTTGRRDVNLYILAYMVVGGYFALVGLLSFVSLPTVNIGPINQLYGALIIGFGVVLGYFFGSSASSKNKDDTINKLSLPSG